MQLHQHCVLEFAESVDLAFRLFVLEQRLLDAVFRVELWVLSLVDVVEDGERNMNLLDLGSFFVNLL